MTFFWGRDQKKLFWGYLRNPWSKHSVCSWSCCFVADLKAFERRLTEYVSCLQPATGRWRSKWQQQRSYNGWHLFDIAINLKEVHVDLKLQLLAKALRWVDLNILFLCFLSVILIVVSVCTATGAWNWLIDPDTQKVSICRESLTRREIRGIYISLVLNSMANRDKWYH